MYNFELEGYFSCFSCGIEWYIVCLLTDRLCQVNGSNTVCKVIASLTNVSEQNYRVEIQNISAQLEKAGRHTKESGSIRHWKHGKDDGNHHTYLGRFGMATLSSPMQSPETEDPPQCSNRGDSFASAGPCHSPAANHQEPSSQAHYPNQYIYRHIQVQLLAKNHHRLECHPPPHDITQGEQSSFKKTDSSSDVIR